MVFTFSWAAAALNGCNKKEKEPALIPPTNNKNSNGNQTSSGFQFKKEGELQFVKGDSNIVTKIDIEIAETDAEQQQGLMNRPKMEETQGMLFIFKREAPQSFWMKNTIISLDIIYIDAKHRIVSIAKDAQPYSTTALPSQGPAQYVVEVIAGFADKYNLKSGDLVQWQKM